MKKFKAVVFDIDGTLTRHISWVILTESLGGSVEYNDDIVKKWDTDEISKDIALENIRSNWIKGGKKHKNDFIKILDSIPLREDALEAVNYLKSKGYYICAITGSVDIYAEIICKHLGIDTWYAITDLHWNNQNELIKVNTVKSFESKDKKVEFFLEFCNKHNILPDECVPIGDSSNDIALFKVTGNGIAVRTEFEAKELEEIAWKKIDHLIELKEIL